ncbi:predicted protein [Chaetomium globosum CBS 148.51]|uniref:AA1-like domain-containing protein n=1 Tax=Chaetomium globosum (strain ATCC 6205 / CBS 148.51 / DSM 1962 / NBRC 6347 / NRRL 1970) TaxID=306901 RepID=Q2HDY0_CHAGB|nr:uncharacterized protein CHGG_01574 [Chaetomium globosum CBS 148.51]EAQ93339.1 predicted protein [Chaetomium globosum CBS 148.51]
MATVQLAVASPTYKIPLALSRVAHKGQFCTYPEEFVVKNFRTWTPEGGNNRSATVEFDYTDDSVMPAIETKCHFNETSVNVGPQDLAARYACENSLVEFIWNERELTMVERACPFETENRPFEAAGWVTPNMKCTLSTRNGTADGQACSSSPSVLSAVFNSLEPRPN